MPGKRISLICLLALLLVLPTTGLALEKGESFPELSGRLLDGSDFSLDSLKGRPVLMKIGTTWCPTCGQQSREIAKIADFLKKNQIQYVEIFVQEPADKVRRYFKKNNYHQPDTIILDDGTIGRALNLYLIPRLLLIDVDFKVYRDGEPLMAAEVKKLLQNMLAD